MYGIQAHDDELINNAVEIKMRAKQRAGQMVTEAKDSGQLAKQGNQPKGSHAVTFGEVGISKKDSHQYQQLAKVPEQKFEKAIEVVKKRDGVLTEAALSSPHPCVRHTAS